MTTDNTHNNSFGWPEMLGLAGFFLVGLLLITHHEMWGDELQHWAIAQASGSVGEIFDNLEYESSPALWHMILYPVTRVTHNPEAMQHVHLLLATLATAVFLRWSPFGRAQKLLFIFGYFPLYEYGVISRHYVLGELLLFVFLALYPWRGWRAIAAAAALFLVAHSSFFGLIFAVAGAAAMTVRHLGQAHAPGRGGHWQLIVPLVIVVVGCLWSLVQIMPQQDAGLHPAWDFIAGWHALQAATTPWRAVVPLARFEYLFWNTNILDPSSFAGLWNADHLASLLGQGLLSAVIVIGSAWYFCRRREALVFFLVIVISCAAFFYLKKRGYARHHGHLYLAWIGALWLVWRAQWDAMRSSTVRRPRAASQIGMATLVLLVLAAHVAAGAYAAVMDYRHPFASSAQAASLIRTQGRQDDVIIANAAIGALLDRDVYLPHERRSGRFHVWRHANKKLAPSELVEWAEQLHRTHAKPVLIVLPEPIANIEIMTRLELIGMFTDTLNRNGRHAIYTLRTESSATPAPSVADPGLDHKTTGDAAN